MFYGTLLAFLVRGWQVILWLGVILVATGWFAGSNASGAAVRTWVSGGLETAGAAMADGPVGRAGRWSAVNARWLRVAVGVLGTVVRLWGNDVWLSRLFWSLVLVVVLLGIVQVLVGAGAKRAPSRASAAATGPSPVIRRTLAGSGAQQRHSGCSRAISGPWLIFPPQRH